MEYQDVTELFQKIENCNYLVLRNFEDFEKENFLLDHPDIDLLCTDVHTLVQALQAFPKGKKDDGLHYAVTVNGNRVPIDMRVVGDGYYDTAWEAEIVKKRIKRKNYFCMDTENYFYSLLYHAIIHKTEISDDYIIRLQTMAEKLGINFSADSCLSVLEKYMRTHGYRYTYPKSITTNAHLEKVDRSLIRFSFVHFYRSCKSGIKKYIKSIMGRN